MPKLIIDEQPIEVAPGTKVIEAAEQMGIVIPRFCYHPALGSVGACRVCAVKFLQGPFKGVQMSCMIDAKDGMVVSTTAAEAVEFRRHVIEWLMMNHPHDCPVCDEGGHCLLQDMTISGGHGIRRYPGKKRTYPDQYLGPLVQHEMNRCIHCYRCARFYQEYTGYQDLGVLQNGNRTYFGRFASGELESPFAGNLSDICPTGVYTDKPSRYKGRRWDYQRSPTICIHCSLGCHMVVSVRYREIVRHEARYSRIINNHFICDRGRFGFYYCEDKNRPRRARVDGQPVTFADGPRSAAARLAAVAEHNGPGAVACVGGLRSSLETQTALHRLCRRHNWQGPTFFMDHGAQKRVSAASRRSPGLGVSLRKIEQADLVLVVGADPLNEAPMLALALRQAQRKGATVVVMDPRPVTLPLVFTRLVIHPDKLGRVLGWVAGQSVTPTAAASLGSHATGFFNTLGKMAPPEPALEEALKPVADLLRASRRPVIVCGTEIACDGLPDLAADIALLLNAGDRSGGLFYTLPGASAFSAAQLGEYSLDEALTGIETGAVKALLVVESDPFSHYPDQKRLETALERLELLVVLDYLDSRIARQAHILLPTATVYETGGHFVNQEGRVQFSPAAHEGGISVLQSGGGGHPPREYAAAAPEAGQPPAWRALAALDGAAEAIDPMVLLQELGETVPGFQPLARPDPIPPEGLRLSLPVDESRFFDPARLSNPRPSAHGLRLVLTEWTLGTEALSVRSACLEKVTPEPCMTLHPADAARLKLADGKRATVETGIGQLTATVRIVDPMAEGVLVLPRHHRLAWQIFNSDNMVIPLERITPVGESAG
jgi:NADH-quinone oxidoreductase subunit G